MIVTDNDIALLKVLSRFYVMTRSQIHRVCFPAHSDGRATRKRLKRLVYGGYVQRHDTRVALSTGNAAPVYYPTAKALSLLASHFDDEEYLHARCNRPRSDRLLHWIAITETHLVIEQAIALQQDVMLDAWHNEWTTVNKSDHESRHYYLQYGVPAESAAFVFTRCRFSALDVPSCQSVLSGTGSRHQPRKESGRQ